MAPGAENRSVICDVIAALWSAASRSSDPTRAPTRRAGMRNNGSSTTVISVIGHDRPAMTTKVSTRAMTLVTTPDSAEVNARWAPITSLFRRLTSAPVRVRVKKATGIRCTCSKTRRRSSRMRSSPRRDDCSRATNPTAASSRASTAITTARAITVLAGPPSTMAFTAWPAMTGAATPNTAEIVASTRYEAMVRLWGWAKRPTRRTVSHRTACREPSSCMALRSAIHVLTSVTLGSSWSPRAAPRSAPVQCGPPSLTGRAGFLQARTSSELHVNGPGQGCRATCAGSVVCIHAASSCGGSGRAKR